MVLYQPQDIVYADVNGTTVISCESNESLEDKSKVSWYRKSWRTGEAPLRVKSCYNGAHKYTCKNNKYKATLEIHNVQTNDSGVYFCTFLYGVNLLKYGNGTTLIAADSSTSRSSVHLLAPAQPPLPNTTLQLACMVRGARHTVHVTWNISGIHHMGRMISMEESGGTWTFLNLISLPRNTWDHGVHVTCEVWFNSSPVCVHWEISERGEIHSGFTSICQTYLIPALTSGLLLLLALSVHLIWTYKHSDNKTPGSNHKDTETEDGIVYSHLDMYYLTRGRK
ncbi:uncharacterized protein LOC142112089 isoform X2 [Mixophyes fleayi]|uniref:uncharacterized protein LOC142112089 isoform X2 n=1 Tax=Mixophyes fleayi TaxID=3061075 RepID=UPI003F4DD7F3